MNTFLRAFLLSLVTLLLQVAPGWVYAQENQVTHPPLHSVVSKAEAWATSDCSLYQALLTAWEEQGTPATSDTSSGIASEDERFEMHAPSITVDVLPSPELILVPWTARALPEPWIPVPQRPPKRAIV